MNINSTIDYCLGLSHFELQHFAGDNYQKVYGYLASNYDGSQANTMLVGSIFTCIASDGTLSEAEWQFILQFVGGYSYDDALEVAGRFYNGESQDLARRFGMSLPSDIRDAFLCICIAVLCVDKRLNDAEVDFLKKVLGY